jgi:hypothetical protein
VTDTYFTTGVSYSISTTNGDYGFNQNLFEYGRQSYGYNSDDGYYLNAFRFIAIDENDGQRWSTGDTIDLFWLDYENHEF